MSSLMEDDSEFTLSESLDSGYLIRVEQLPDAFLAERTYIATKTLSQPVDEDEEEFTLDSLDFNFTTCGDASSNRKSLIGQMTCNNLSTIAINYASTSAEEDKFEDDEEEETEKKESSSEGNSDLFDPLELLVTKKHFNFKDLTPKQAWVSISKLGTRLETSKNMYPTMIKDNVKRNLEKIVQDLKRKMNAIEEERKRPITVGQDDELDLLNSINNQLEYKLMSLTNRMKKVMELKKSSATE